jgi:hypothetical protein
MLNLREKPLEDKNSLILEKLCKILIDSNIDFENFKDKCYSLNNYTTYLYDQIKTQKKAA